MFECRPPQAPGGNGPVRLFDAQNTYYTKSGAACN